ncbi:MAG TPA: hypothetical protein VHK69_03265 [Chitinophagaceae bacterium]|jgi:hypothetical protein|nr:hypothetical protein [Chitinophagaceae bacterium]
MRFFHPDRLLLLALLGTGAVSCDKSGNNGGTKSGSEIVFENKSVTPALVKKQPGFDGVNIFTLISGDDVLEGTPDFVFGAQPDGAGLLKDPAGEGYIMINNHEILRSVSRVYLDKTLKPVKGEYIVDGDGGMWRLCSATMATPEEHGFGPLFLTAGESGADSRVHAIDPFAPVSDKKRTDRVLPALGRASMENAVPLPKDAFAGKTVIVIGEDDSNGQVVLYVSNTAGDLNNGKLYMLRRKDQNPVETDMAVGTTYDVEFVEIANHASATGAEIAAQSVTDKAVQFARVEDLDYRKGGGAAGRELYFVSTGVANTAGKTMWGRMYRLVFDAGNPLSGKLTPVADGGVNPGNDLINPDNVCVTENYVYIQEDGDSFYPDAKHDSYIWQYTISTGAYKPFITTWQRREDPVFNSAEINGGYNQSGNNDKFGSWEFGAMYDISGPTGAPGTFLLNIHPHTWRKPRFLNADGSTVSGNSEGGQVVILQNVPR